MVPVSMLPKLQLPQNQLQVFPEPHNRKPFELLTIHERWNWAWVARSRLPGLGSFCGFDV